MNNKNIKHHRKIENSCRFIPVKFIKDIRVQESENVMIHVDSCLKN